MPMLIALLLGVVEGRALERRRSARERRARLHGRRLPIDDEADQVAIATPRKLKGALTSTRACRSASNELTKKLDELVEAERNLSLEVIIDEPVLHACKDCFRRATAALDASRL